jgi:asparagine synthase (glutamine-hydrolysing)
MILREAMDGVLPPAVQWRLTKADLGSNVRRGLFTEREALDAIIIGGSGVLEPYVDTTRLKAAYSRFTTEHARASDLDVFTVFLCAVVGNWLTHLGTRR